MGSTEVPERSVDPFFCLMGTWTEKHKVTAAAYTAVVLPLINVGDELTGKAQLRTLSSKARKLPTLRMQVIQTIF